MGKFIDLTGQKFGKLIVVSRTERGQPLLWNCICECGNKVVTNSYRLRSGEKLNCGHRYCRKKVNFKDISGQRFGKLTVTCRIPYNKIKGTAWICFCDCGRKVIASTYNLLKGKIKTCGNESCRILEDLTGQRFGKLIVVSMAERDQNKQTRWNCICDCGNKCVILTKCLLYNNTKSCGCLCSWNRYVDKSQSSKNHLFYKYKKSAIDRDFPFNIDFKNFIKLTQQPCYYCGKLPSKYFQHTGTKEGFLYNGIDRLYSKKGYYIDNVVPCCKECNYLKWDRDRDEFIKWLENCYNNLNNSITYLDLINDEFYKIENSNNILIKEQWVCNFDCEYKCTFPMEYLKSAKSCAYLRDKFPDTYYSKNTLYQLYKNIAIKKGYIFELGFEYFFNLTQMNCFYCGISPSKYQKKGSQGGFYYNGIDRVDNHKGYDRFNVVPCCKACNSSKMNLTYKDFSNKIKKCYEYLKSKENIDLLDRCFNRIEDDDTKLTFIGKETLATVSNVSVKAILEEAEVLTESYE